MIDILSYNIWFSKKSQKTRTAALVHTITAKNADVVCLQEVTQNVFDILVRDLGYPYHYPDVPAEPYDCVIFSRTPLSDCRKYCYVDSTMGRCLYAAKIPHGITIATSHFESQFGTRNSTKISQYKQALEILNEEANYGPVIFCCDTNILPHEESCFMSKLWSDAWTVCGNQESRYTYDSTKNTNAKRGTQARIDRIIYRGVCSSSFQLVSGNPEPSDHFGVLASIGMTENIEI